MPLSFPAVSAAEEGLFPNWWNEINDSIHWRDWLLFTLCAEYALISSIALIQLIRIQSRGLEYGWTWTIQKVFHLMMFIVNTARAILFGLHKEVFLWHPRALTVVVLLDLPGLVFFSTYTLLILFWAEIYHEDTRLPTKKLRRFYFSTNDAVYIIQFCIWALVWMNVPWTLEFLGKIFMAVVSFRAGIGFLLYGGRCFPMLRSVPTESTGRRKKLHEVGSVTAICFSCFLIRCFVVAISAFDSDASLYVLDHPVLNLIYYTLFEILPSALVLYILHELPANGVSTYVLYRPTEAVAHPESESGDEKSIWDYFDI